MRVLYEAGRRSARFSLLAATFALAGLVGTASAAAAQERTVECRCVDGAGDPVDDCVCLTTPRVDGLYAALPFARRSIVGVTIDFDQGAEVDALGAELQDVQGDGPARRAGLRAGDVVTHVDGRSVFDPLESRRERALDEDQSLPVQRFVQLVGALDPDEEVEIRYLRDGAARSATVTPVASDDLAFPVMGAFPELRVFSDSLPAIGFRFERDGEGRRFTLPEGFEGRRWSPEGSGVFHFESPEREIRVFGDGEESFARRFRVDPCIEMTSPEDGRVEVRVFGMTNCVNGVEFVELNEGLGEYFGTERGVLVAEVSAESTLGLRPGDVLMAIDGRTVDSVEEARRILRSYTADDELRLRVMRRGSETEILARMP